MVGEVAYELEGGLGIRIADLRCSGYVAPGGGIGGGKTIVFRLSS